MERLKPKLAKCITQKDLTLEIIPTEKEII